jgi:signal transduction histidine kinase
MANHTALERRVANLEKMVQVSRALRSAFDLQSLLQVIIRAIVELVQCERSSILLVDPSVGELRFAAASDTDFDKLRGIVVPRQGSVAGAIAETRQPVMAHDAQVDPRFFPGVDRITGQSTESLLGVPLEIGGRVIGVLEAVNKKGGQVFDQEDLETLLMFAPQAAAAIENTQLIEEQRQRLTESMLIQEVLLTLSRFVHVEQLLGQLLVLLEEFLDYANCAILMLDQDRENLSVVAVRGFDGANIDSRILALDAQSVSGQAAVSKTPLNVSWSDGQREPAPFLANTRSALSVPMVGGIDVDLVGVISLESPEPQAFSQRDVRILTTIATQAAIGVRQAELYEESQRANQLKQEFITTMSHELRTPMTVLIGYSEMLLSGALGALNERQADAVGIVRHRAGLLLRLLNDILDFSKLVSGEFKLYPTVVNLRQAVRLVAEKQKANATRQDQRISVDVPANCRYVAADDQRLHQILGHLLENAIKFSPRASPISIRARPHGKDYVRIDVIDRGIGIKPEDMDVIFEDFRQLDSSFTREYSGAGMGLAISRHLVELQGGMIWVESEYGQGSTFSFILPRSVT